MEFFQETQHLIRGQAGITRALSYDPKITSVRGYIPYLDGEKISAANMLSPTELLSPFTAASADAPRAAMQVSQTGHGMPIEHPSKQLICSGMNKTLPFLISDDFCFKAKEDGVILKVDKTNQLVILKYDNDVDDAIDMKDKLSKNSGMGFYIHQEFVLVYSEGERFKKGDVLAYNKSYFRGKGKNIDYLPGTLAKLAIAPGDFSFEDSTMISEKLSQKCVSKVNMLKDAVLGKNAEIYNIVDVGDSVKAGDALIEFTSSFDDPDTASFLAGLSAQLGDETLEEITKEEITAKYSGKITDIQILYNCPFEELSPSLQKLIKKYKGRIINRQKALGNIKAENVHIPPLEQLAISKAGKSEFPDGGGVIINIWIRKLYC